MNALDLMQTPVFSLQWYDEDQTILYVVFKMPWSWNDIYQASDRMTKEIAARSPHNVYSVIEFLAEARIVFPRVAGIQHMRNLMKDSPNEPLQLVINPHFMIKRIAIIASQLYRMDAALNKIVFVDNLAKALVKVEEHKYTQTKEW